MSLAILRMFRATRNQKLGEHNVENLLWVSGYLDWRPININETIQVSREP
jgi:hypothetical protein